MKKNISKLIISIAIIIFSTSCSEHSNKYKTILNQKTDSLSLSLPIVRSTDWVENIEKIGKDSLIFFLRDSYESYPVLYKFSLSTGKYDSIDVSKFIPQNSILEYFHYINKDSILLFLYHSSLKTDSSILLVNDKAELKKVFPINYKKFPTTKEPFKRGLFQQAFVTSKPITYFSDNKMFTTTEFLESHKFNYDFVKNHKAPLIGYYDFDRDTIIMNNDIWFPSIKQGAIYSKYAIYHISHCLSPKGNPIVGFRYTDKLFEWDLATDKVIEHSIKSQLLDSILPLKYKGKTIAKQQISYSILKYDKKLKMYTRTISFPEDKYGDFKNIVVFADDNFNYLGETYNSDIWYCFEDEWFPILQNNKSKKISFIKPHFTWGDLDSSIIRLAQKQAITKRTEEKEQFLCSIKGKIKKEYKKEIFAPFAENYLNIKDSTYLVIVVNEGGCHSCNEYILDVFKANRKAFSSYPIYLLMIANTQDFISINKEKYNLNNWDKIKTVDNNKYKMVELSTSHNPRLILVKDKKIISDSIYNPSNLKTIMPKALGLFGKQWSTCSIK